MGQLQDAIAAHKELGANYNGWSLTESSLSAVIEQTGEAIDSTEANLTTLSSLLDERFTDRLYEYGRFAHAIDKLLRWRHKKHCEFEQISENLITKQALLTKLESSEYEAQRLAAALKDEGLTQTAPPKGLLATINSLIDNDPEATRRNTISKTKDLIIQLEEAREKTREELLQGKASIQRELDRFQRQKIEDVRSMMTSYALAHKEYHAKSIQAWKEVKASIDRI